MTKARLNIGVVGLGRMGRLYAHALASQVSGAALYAVAEPDALARAAGLTDLSAPHVLADVHDLLALPELDALVIATPTSTHSALVIAAAAVSKPIFCEKPLALTLADTHAALDAVRRAGVPLQVGFMRRFDLAYQRAMALIADGRIGTPTTFKSIGRDPFCPRPEYADPAHSGGLIVDMAIHDFDLARWLVGSEVERVSAEGATLVCDELRAVGDIDNAVINLRFVSGAIGNVEVSRNAFYGYDIRTEVLGSEGAVTIGAHGHTPVLLLTRAGGQHDLMPYLMERFGDAYRAQIQHFVDCLREDRTPSVGGNDGLAALEIAVAATRAYQEGRAVVVDEVRSSRQ
ncbi:MAG TPA: inositol 2-dehydrogenase, partial [Roseiflexaceae bacterium]|nr:inositol 2-dehydrogenase [Roseiflexaceae bacterium]